MKKLLLAAGFIGAVLQANAQDCAAVATLNEDFSNFTINLVTGFPQNCWTKLAPGYPGVSVYTAEAGEPANQYATYYPATNVNTPGYLFTPEISTFDGNHQLTFNAWKPAGGPNGVPAGTVTIQVGTVTNTADATTFVAAGNPISVSTGDSAPFTVAIPSAPAGSHIAFQFSSDTPHAAVAVDDIKWDEIPAPGCEPVATIDEDFTEFTAGPFQQNCWTASHPYPMTSVDAEAEGSEEKSVTIYSFFSPNTPIYVVSPEVSSMDGNHQLSFSVIRQVPVMPGASVSLQVGTLSVANDYTTFVPFGDAIAVESTTEALQMNDLKLPASTTQKYIAFQVTATAEHTAIALDNVKWQTTASTGIVNAKAFTLYPNPAKGNVNIVNNANTNGTVNIFSLTGAQVYSAKIGAGEQSLNLSGLQSGMYIVQVQAGSAVTTQKLILE